MFSSDWERRISVFSIMPLGTKLSEFEKGKVVAFHNSGLAVSQIATKLNRSRTVIYNFLKNPYTYGRQRHTGRPSSVTAREKRLIIKRAISRKQTSTEIKRELNLRYSARTVRRVLQKETIVHYGKLKSQPPLTKVQKRLRLEFAKKYIAMGKKWDDVVFSDEKRFNLDGPDGYRYFWYDLRKQKEVFSKRKFGGGSLMIWGGFATVGTTPIVFVQGKMNSESYVDILADNLLPIAPLITSGDYLFQQDNAAVHVSESSRSWFEANFVKLLEWPAQSPDLNPMENLWGILAREVYKNGMQYKNKQELMTSIKKAWKNIPKNVLKELTNSMTSRLIKVIEKKGDIINY